MWRMNDWIGRWQQEVRVAPASELFVRVIYLVVLWNTLRLLMIGDVVWGTEWVARLFDPYEGFDHLATLLGDPSWRAHYFWFVIPMIALLVLGLAGWHHFLSRVAVWYLFVVLHYGNVEVSTGGHHLVEQVLGFHIFLFRVSDGDGWWVAVRRFLHNVSHYAIWVQVCVMYLITAYWKTEGMLWLSGEAMLMSMSWADFGFPWIAERMHANTWYLQAINYIVLAYQVLFAFTIWIRPIRTFWLWIGLVFHLSIAFVVGITDFGLMMVACYSIFIEPAKARDVLAVLKWKGKPAV